MTDSADLPIGPVLLDTDVFSKVFVQSPRDAAGHEWATALQGRTVVIAVQTEVELRLWPALKNWGDKRTLSLEQRIAAVPTIPINDRVKAAYVDLTLWARKSGHGIHAKAHVADRWVAATALAYGLELAAIDHIYGGIDGLALLSA